MSFAGRLIYRWLPVRRRIVIENMRQVYPGRTETQIRDLAQGFYGHLWNSIHDMIRMFWMSDDDIRRHARVEGEEHLRRANREGKGALILTGHFGSWEFVPIAAMMRFQAYRGKFLFIRKTLPPPFERILFRRFYRAGLGVIPKRGGLQMIFDAIEQNNAVVFILDQHSSPGSRNGIPVEFFGRPAGTNRSLAMLAAHTGSPVIPASAWREPDGRHVMRFHPPLEWIRRDDPEQEILANTRKYNEVLERFILEHPEQWFWFHRRWKAELAKPGR